MAESTADYTTVGEALNLTTLPDVSTHFLSTENIFYCIVGLIGFLDNLLVIVVIMTSPRMRKRRTNWFLLNQSFVDMLTGVILALSTYRPPTDEPGLQNRLYCKLWHSVHFLWALAMTSTYSLLTITLERYLAIVHPVWHKNHMGKRLTYSCLALPWFVGNTFTLFTPTVAKLDPVTFQCRHLQFNSQTAGRIVALLAFFMQYFLPLATMIICYSRMIFVLRSKSSGPNTDRAVNGSDVSKARARDNVIKTLISVLLAFVVCWSWNQIFFLLYNVGVSLSFSTFYQFSVVMAHINCTVNPFIYAAKYTEFRAAFMALFCRYKVSAIGDSGASQTTSHSVTA